jgi:hypothetical protein
VRRTDSQVHRDLNCACVTQCRHQIICVLAYLCRVSKFRNFCVILRISTDVLKNEEFKICTNSGKTVTTNQEFLRRIWKINILFDKLYDPHGDQLYCFHLGYRWKYFDDSTRKPYKQVTDAMYWLFRGVSSFLVSRTEVASHSITLNHWTMYFFLSIQNVNVTLQSVIQPHYMGLYKSRGKAWISLHLWNLSSFRYLYCRTNFCYCGSVPSFLPSRPNARLLSLKSKLNNQCS